MTEENKDLEAPPDSTDELMGTPLQGPEQATEQGPEQARGRILAAESGVVCRYSNFSYTAGTREGVLFAFGVHDWQGKGPIKIDTKLEMSYYNAKRLLVSLNQMVRRHEEVFGPLELDLNKRVVVKARSS